MNFNIFVIFITLYIFVPDYCIAQDKEKTCRISLLESRLKTLIGQFGMRDHKWPENEQEMQLWCKSVPRDGSAAKAYVRKCMNGLSSTIMSVSIFAGDKVARTYCNNKKERGPYIAKAKCGNKGKKDTVQCWNRLINVISNVKFMNVSTEKIPAFCCAFFQWRDCTLDVYKKIGSPGCSATDIEGMDNQISRGSLDPLNIFCSNYDESDKCDKINEKFVTTPPKKRFRTPFPAIVEVFDSL